MSHETLFPVFDIWHKSILAQHHGCKAGDTTLNICWSTNVAALVKYMLNTMSCHVEWSNKLVNAIKAIERTLTKIETSAIVFNTLLQHFLTMIKIEQPPYSQNLMPSPFARSTDFSYPLQIHYSIHAFVFLSLSPSDFRLVGSMFT